ncbi:MAG: transcription elongation factor GreA [Magnetococcales bacterium]|nr:transcription elongation factor GreA [Magnetococcales bacterium]
MRHTMSDKVPMTLQGAEQLRTELKWRKGEERSRIVEAIATAREHGDLSENAEYHAAKEQQSFNEGRIQEIEGKIAMAEVIDTRKIKTSKVVFGAHVEVVDEETDEEFAYHIVGDDEADFEKGKISISSPMARAMIGKEEGDSIEVKAPGGVRAFEILDVNYA